MEPSLIPGAVAAQPSGAKRASLAPVREPRGARDARGAEFSRDFERVRSEGAAAERSVRADRTDPRRHDRSAEKPAPARADLGRPAAHSVDEAVAQAKDPRAPELGAVEHEVAADPESAVQSAPAAKGEPELAVAVPATAGAEPMPMELGSGGVEPSLELLNALLEPPLSDAPVTNATASGVASGARAPTSGAPSPAAEMLAHPSPAAASASADSPSVDAPQVALEALGAADDDGAPPIPNRTSAGEVTLSNETGRGAGNTVTAPAADANAAQATESRPSPATTNSEQAAEILRQVRLRISPELRQAVIQLEPRELGRIAIKISVARGIVRAELRAEHASTLEALERHAPELKAALERVGLGADSIGLELGFQDAPDEKPQARGGARASAPSKPAERVLSTTALSRLAQRINASGVDTYA